MDLSAAFDCMDLVFVSLPWLSNGLLLFFSLNSLGFSCFFKNKDSYLYGLLYLLQPLFRIISWRNLELFNRLQAKGISIFSTTCSLASTWRNCRSIFWVNQMITGLITNYYQLLNNGIISAISATFVEIISYLIIYQTVTFDLSFYQIRKVSDSVRGMF